MDNAGNTYRRYLDGDNEALTELVGQFKEGLTLYLNSIVGNIFTAEELMEEAFFRLITKRPHFSGRSSFKTFLYAIGRNAALDRLRKDKRIDARPIEERVLLAEQRSVEESYLVREDRLAVHRALGELSPDHRQVLYLTYFEELSNKEAASVMKRSVHSIENLVSRARASLKKELEKEGFHYENRF